MADGSFSNNPENSVCHLEILKSNDSVYLVDQYDLGDNLIIQGTYKDQGLSIKNGKFHYYNYSSKSETIGYFLNGQRTGVWYAYDPDGKIADWTYKNGILDGHSKTTTTHFYFHIGKRVML